MRLYEDDRFWVKNFYFYLHVWLCLYILFALKQRELRLLQHDAFASLFVILLVEFKADEVALLADGCNGGGAAAHERVEY